MTFKDVLMKTLLPMMLLAVWAWIAYNFCMSIGQIEWWKIWMMIGMPFGIHRVWVWLLPKNFDLGGTVGVWALNVVVGCLVGEVVAIGYVLRAIYVLVKYFVKCSDK